VARQIDQKARDPRRAGIQRRCARHGRHWRSGGA
jgi:hypothetical protein